MPSNYNVKQFLNWLKEAGEGLVHHVIGELVSRKILTDNPKGDGKILNPQLVEALSPVIARDLIDEEIVNEFIAVMPEQTDRDKLTRWLYSLGKTQRTHLYLQLAEGLVGSETETQQKESEKRWLVVISDILSVDDGTLPEADAHAAMTRYASGRKLIREREEDYTWNRVQAFLLDLWQWFNDPNHPPIQTLERWTVNARGRHAVYQNELDMRMPPPFVPQPIHTWSAFHAMEEVGMLGGGFQNAFRRFVYRWTAIRLTFYRTGGLILFLVVLGMITAMCSPDAKMPIQPGGENPAASSVR